MSKTDKTDKTEGKLAVKRRTIRIRNYMSPISSKYEDRLYTDSMSGSRCYRAGGHLERVIPEHLLVHRRLIREVGTGLTPRSVHPEYHQAARILSIIHTGEDLPYAQSALAGDFVQLPPITQAAAQAYDDGERALLAWMREQEQVADTVTSIEQERAVEAWIKSSGLPGDVCLQVNKKLRGLRRARIKAARGK